MKKLLFASIIALLLITTFAAFSSAAYYGDDYKYQYTVRESYDDYGYQYTQQVVNQDPWGKTVTSRVVSDYVTPRSYYTSRNRASDYFNNGPSGYTTQTQVKHLGYGWDDAWRRDVYDSNYHPYYYEPRYNGQYYDWNYGSGVGCSRYSC